MGAFGKAKTMEEFRTAIILLICETLEAVSWYPDQIDHAQVLADEIIFIGCPGVFGVEVSELSFSADVVAAGNCLILEK